MDISFLQSGLGTVATTVQKKLQDIKSLQPDFGAVGDGSADDTTAWNNFTGVVGGGYINPGTYKIGGVTNPYSYGVFYNVGIRSSRTVTDSTYTITRTIDFNMVRTDNSPPVAGAGFISTYYAPMCVLQVDSQSGGVTGDHGVMAKNMPRIFGKSYTTVNQTGGVVASSSAQNVTVVDASVISVGEKFTIDTGLQAEMITALAGTGGTTVTGIFTKNHANGVTLGVRYKGVKLVSANAVGDQAGNSNDILCGWDVSSTASGQPHQTTSRAIQTTNDTGADAYYDSFLGPYISGIEINEAGAHNSTYAINIAGGGNPGRYRTGVSIGSAASYAITIVNNGAGIVDTGISIAASNSFGILIGSNQAVPTVSNYELSDPVHGIFLTSQGSGATAVSNIITFQERRGGVDDTHSLQADGAGRLRHLYNGVESGFRIGSGGTLDKIMNPYVAGAWAATGYFTLNIGGVVYKVGVST